MNNRNMKLDPPLRVCLYWGGGQIHFEDGSISYIPRICNFAILLRHRLGYDELVDKIYQCMAVDKIRFKLKIVLRNPCGAICGAMVYNAVPVVNDETVEIIYHLRKEILNYTAELYIEKEEIVQIPRTNNMVGMNATGPSEWEETPRYINGLDSISSSNQPRSQFDNPVERLVQSEGKLVDNCSALSEEDNEKVDPEDVEKDDSDDGFEANSGNCQQQAEYLSIFGINPRDHLPQRIYIPKGIRFFSDIGNISDDDYDPCDGRDPSCDRHDPYHIDVWSEGNSQISLRLLFESKKQVNKAIRLWSIKQNREFKVVESKKHTWVAKCKSHRDTPDNDGAPSSFNCDWCVRATCKKTHGMWEITKWVNDHSCLGSVHGNKDKNLTSAVIASHILHSIKNDPVYKIKNIQSDIKKKLGVNISYKNAWYSRKKAIELVNGDCQIDADNESQGDEHDSTHHIH